MVNQNYQTKCDRNDCINKDNKCYKCNGSLHYLKERMKEVRYDHISKRKGSKLEVETVRQRPNSGATRFAKGDCISQHTLIECKSTSKNSIRITQEMLDKINNYARYEIKMPVINISLSDGEIYSIVKYKDLMILLNQQ